MQKTGYLENFIIFFNYKLLKLLFEIFLLKNYSYKIMITHNNNINMTLTK